MTSGGVEPETVERYLVWVCGGCEICKPLDGSPGKPMPCTHEAPSVDGAYVVKVEAYDAVVDRLRLVEEELRQAREERDRAVGTVFDTRDSLDAAEADRDRLVTALERVLVRAENQGARGLQWLINDARAALSPVQGERRTQPEGESQMDDNNLNHLIGERDVEKWVDGFLTVVPDADRDLMHTWFACAIESGRMTVQGEHEQGGELAGDLLAVPLADVVYVEDVRRPIRDIDLDVALAEIHQAAMRKLTHGPGHVRRNEPRRLDDLASVRARRALRTSGPQAPIPSPSDPASGCGEIAQDGDTEETT